MGKPKAIIVDVDGTVADMGKGQPGKRGPFDWDRVGEDEPIWRIISLVTVLRNAHLYQARDAVVFLSGRDDVCFQATLEWLFNCGAAKSGDTVHMRPNGDNRPDEIIKEELYRTYVEPHFDVLYVLDDRNKVVRMWRNLGLTCLQVADGDF